MSVAGEATVEKLQWEGVDGGEREQRGGRKGRDEERWEEEEREQRAREEERRVKLRREGGVSGEFGTSFEAREGCEST